jgi:hypothetical protein
MNDYVDPETARSEYQRLFAEHSSEVKRICDNLGIDLYELTTDRSLEMSLFDFLNSRMRRGRSVSRRNNTRRGAAK